VSISNLVDRYRSGGLQGDLFSGEAIPLPDPPPPPNPPQAERPPEQPAPPASHDPRPDLMEDSSLWDALLRIAETRSEKFAGTLHGFRCGGTRIKRGKLGWVLRPDVDPTGRTAWESQAEYDEFKERFLKPYIENGWLLWALRELTKMMPPDGVQHA
jgi:hypothetical protein